MLSRLLRRVTAVCAIPSQSTELAKNIRSLLALGVAPSALPMVALKKLMWRPGVLATPSDLDAWAKIAVLHGSTLRAALEGFASSDTPISSHFVACRLLKSCISLHASKNAVKYLARYLRDAPPATFTASQCIAAIGVLAAYQHKWSDPLYATLVAIIKQKDAGCDPRLVEASAHCAALRPLFTPAFLAGVVKDLQAGVYSPPRAASMLLGLRFVAPGSIVRDLCNAMWRSHSGSLGPEERFKLMRAGGSLDDMRRSLSERSAEYLMVVQPREIFYVVASHWWNVGALHMTLETALLPTVPHLGQKRLLAMLEGQVVLGRFNVPLTDAVAEALGPQHIPLGLACRVLCHSGYNYNEAALTNPQPFLDVVLAARSVDFPKLKSLEVMCHLIKTLVTMRRRGYAEAPVGDALAATAAWVAGTSGKSLTLRGAMEAVNLLRLSCRLTRPEWRTVWDTVLWPMYGRILEGLSTASVGMTAIAFTLAPLCDRGRIGQRLVAVTGDSAEAFRGITVITVILRMAQRALILPSPINAAHLNRHFTHWCRTRSRLSPSLTVFALRVLTMAPRVSPSVLRKMFVDARNMVTSLKSRDVTYTLVAMTRCHCVDTALLDGLMVRALAIAPSWQDDNIGPAILAMAHLRVVCLPVVEALVRRLQTFEAGAQRHAPKVVEALVKLIA